MNIIIIILFALVGAALALGVAGICASYLASPTEHSTSPVTGPGLDIQPEVLMLALLLFGLIMLARL